MEVVVNARAEFMNNILKAQEEADKSDEQKEQERIAAEEQAKLDAETKAKADLENKPAETIENTPTTESQPEVKNWKEILEQEEKEAKEAKEAADKIAAAQKRVEDLENDELYKTIDSLRNQGKNDKEIKKILKSFLEYEPDEYTDRDLYDLATKDEKNEDGQSLSKEEQDEKYEQFLTMPKAVQEGTLSAQRAMLEAKYEEVKKLVQPKTTTSAPSYSEVETKAINDLMSLTDEVVGKKIMGVDVTGTQAKEIYKLAKSLLPTTFNGKAYDVDTAFKNAWTIKMLPFIVKEEAKLTEHATMKRLFTEFHAPSATGKPIDTNPVVVPVLTEAQKLELDMQNKIAQKTDPFGINKN